MFLDEIRDFAFLLNDEVEECFPFGEATFVYKIKGKIFLLIAFGDIGLSINVKCNPEKTIELRERYSAIWPAYHMNKKHWNTILIDGSLSNELVKDFIKDSFELVAEKKRAK